MPATAASRWLTGTTCSAWTRMTGCRRTTSKRCLRGPRGRSRAGFRLYRLQGPGLRGIPRGSGLRLRGSRRAATSWAPSRSFAAARGRRRGGFDERMPYDDWDFWIGCADSGHHGLKVEGTAWHNRLRTNGRGRSEALPELRRTCAMLVRKRPHLYSAGQHAWAEVVLARAVRAGRADEVLRHGRLRRRARGASGAAERLRVGVRAAGRRNAADLGRGIGRRS